MRALCERSNKAESTTYEAGSGRCWKDFSLRPKAEGVASCDVFPLLTHPGLFPPPVSQIVAVAVLSLSLSLRARPRTDDEIADAASVDLSTLRDNEADSARVQKEKWLVILGICTHLGCVPISGAGDYGGWFCPCHGSHYDVSGRIRKGPAPLNMEVPPYKFVEENKILIG